MPNNTKTGWAILSMNNPHAPLAEEVSLAKRVGFDGTELTVEPTMSYYNRLAEMLAYRDTFKVGHTRDDLTWADASDNCRQNALKEAYRILETFNKIGVKLVSFHPDRGASGLSRTKVLTYNIEAFSQLVDWGKQLDATIAIENQPPLSRPEDFSKILAELSDLKLLLDLAHAVCHYGHYGPYEYIDQYADRISHLHISDNGGIHDDHYFVGQGRICFADIFRSLRSNLPLGVPVTLEAYRVPSHDGSRFASSEERLEGLKTSLALLRNYVC